MNSVTDAKTPDLENLRQALTARGLEAMTLLTQRPDTVVFSASNAGEAVIIKASTHRRAHEVETTVLSGLDGRADFVPRLRTVFEIPPYHVRVTTRLPGVTSWLEREDTPTEARRLACETTGELAGRLQRAMPESELLDSRIWWRNGMAEHYPGWKAYLMGRLEGWLETLHTAPGGGPAPGEAELKARLSEAAPDRLEIVHADLVGWNILFDAQTGRATGLIDFDSTMVGDGLYAIAKTVWVDLDLADRPAREALQRGWAVGSGSRADPSLLATYVGVQCVAAMSWVARRPDETGAAEFGERARTTLERLHHGVWVF
jgi:hypothetical protein